MRWLYVSRLALLGLIVVATTACDGCRRRAAPNQKANAAASAEAQRVLILPPLQAPDRATTLAVRGQVDAELLVPVGITQAKPVLAILLPDPSGLRQKCEALGQGIRQGAFVLCQAVPEVTSTTAVNGGDFEPTASALRAALHSIKRKFGRYVATTDLALVGVGSGSEKVAPIVRQVPDYFQRVALLDGGFRQWTSVDSARFIAAGGKAMLARCLQDACRSEAMRVVATIKASGIATRIELELTPSADTASAVALAWLMDVVPSPAGRAVNPAPPPLPTSAAPAAR